MAKTLIIAEKPNVARDLATILGVPSAGGVYENAQYVITNCIGHLLETEMPPFDNQPLPFFFDEKLKVAAKTAGQFEVVKNQLQRSDIACVVNACDAGREGEAIFWRVYDFVGCRLPMKRLWVTDSSREGYLHGLKNLQDSSTCTARYLASCCRSKGDAWVGVNGSRSTFTGIGRVQTPTLYFVVSAYLNHIHFKPSDYWELSGTFDGGKGQFACRLYDEKGERIRKFDTLQAYQDCAAQLVVPMACKIEDKSVQQKSNPHLLYDGTDLQKDAFRKFGYSMDETLSIMQELYDKYKTITYPRSDFKHLPVSFAQPLSAASAGADETSDSPASNINMEKVFSQLQNSAVYGRFAQDIISNKRIDKNNKRIFDNSKIGDHHAIVPTGIILVNGREVALGSLSPQELAAALPKEAVNILDLIVRRTLAAFLPSAEYAKTERTITTENGMIFKTSGRVLVKEGWLAVWGKEAEDGQDGALPAVADNGTGTLCSVKEVALKTKAPPLLNQATLAECMVSAGKHIDDKDLGEILNDKGIGTAATRPGIVAKLMKSTSKRAAYMHEDAKKNLIPSPQAIELCQFLEKVAPLLLSPQMTAEWEEKLAAIEKGTMGADEFDKQLKEFIEQIVNQVKQNAHLLPTGSAPVQVGVCPNCQKGQVTLGKYRWYCSNKCGFDFSNSLLGVSVNETMAAELVAKGRYDKMLTLTSPKTKRTFPAFLELQDDAEKGRKVLGIAFPPKTELNSPCPCCGGQMLMSQQVASCANESCGFKVWRTVCGAELSQQDVEALCSQGRTERKVDMVSPKSGKRFAAVLVLADKDGKKDVVFELAAKQPFKVPCPCCNSPMLADDRLTECTDAACGFKVWRTFLGVSLTEQDVVNICSHKKTRLISGLKGKSGKTFSAHLYFDKEKKTVGMAFENKHGKK